MGHVSRIASTFILTIFVAGGVVVAQTTGTISGTVKSATTAAPVTAAYVVVIDATGNWIASASNSSGAFSSSVAAGTYYLRVTASGFAPQRYDGVPCAAADCSPTSGTAVTVTAGSTTAVNVTLQPEGRISGTVRRASDGTAVTTTIRVYNAAGSLASYTSSDASGAYSIGQLPSGTYYARTDSTASSHTWLDELYGGTVCSSVRGVSCPVVNGTPITVTAGATTSGVDFSLDTAGTITGVVTAPVSPPQQSSADVWWVSAYSGVVSVAYGVADATGRYTISGLSPGTYLVRTNTPKTNLIDQWSGGVCVGCAGVPTGVTVAAGGTTQVNFQLTTGGGISGTLTLGQPAFAYQMEGILNSPPEIDVYSSSGVLVKTFTPSGTASTIQWEIDGLSTGTYYVRTASHTTLSRLYGLVSGRWVDELYDNITCVAEDCRPTRGTPVAVTAGSVTSGVNFTLDYGATISGHHPAPSVYTLASVAVYDSRGVRLPNRTAVSLMGMYAAAGLPAGTYYLKLERDDPSGRWPAALFSDIPCDGCAVTSGTPVVLALGEYRDQLSIGALTSYAIKGTVRSSASAPLSTIRVDVFAANGALEASATSYADGTYSVPGLNSGTYYLRTYNERGFVDAVYGLGACPGCDPTSGTAVTIASADVTGIDFSLTAGANVSGSISSSSVPLVSAGVSLYTSAGTLAARAQTDASGQYVTTMPSGSYRALSEPVSGYVQQLYNGTSCPKGACDVTAGTAISVSGTAVTGIDFALTLCAAMTLSPVTLANGAVGYAYRQVLTVSGTSTSVRFAVVSGALPTGLSLDASTGVISGTPTAAGRYTFTVAAEDTAGCVVSRVYTLDIPSCVFNAPASLTVAAAGESFLLGQSCTESWNTASDSSWITASRVTTTRSTPFGTTEYPAVAITVAANTGSAPRTGYVVIGPKVVRIYQAGTANSAPYGVVDAPADGVTVSGSLAITGWALDDLRVKRLTIYRDAVSGETAGVQVYIGDATFVPGARPDVEAAYPGVPYNTRAGWGYLLLTNMLPGGGNGTFRLYAFAQDDDGHSTLLGFRAITAANSTATVPFGAIDTPAQGETVSGSNYINWGWALTPQPKSIAIDGSTIAVYIDGVRVGTLNAYNLYRPDVATLFPGLQNSGGAVGYRAIDTTALSEGVHTISWVATDDAGAATGIGSRYFTVQNSAWTGSLRAGVPSGSSRTSETIVPPRVAGVDIERRAASLRSAPLDAEGARTLSMVPLQLIELDLRPADAVCEATYEGYEVVRGELRDLPVGASLDRGGIFYWQPGPGFIGTYRLVFVRTNCDGTRERVPVTVVISGGV